jgi:hypothetical protein
MTRFSTAITRVLLSATFLSSLGLSRAEDLVIDNFEGSGATWTAQSTSEIDAMSQEAAKSGTAGLKWTFKPDGVNRYGNEVAVSFPTVEASKYKAVKFECFVGGLTGPLGRIGCQLLNQNKNEEISMDDISGLVEENKWTEVVLPIPLDVVGNIDGIKFFYDGIAYKDYRDGDDPVVCFIDDLRLSESDTADRVSADNTTPLDPSKAGELFTNLSSADQVRLRLKSAPKPLKERVNPYSTPMYYPQWGGSSEDGTQRSDWQEALVREFAELGMSQLHLYWYPNGVGTDKINYTLTEGDKTGLSELVRLCKKYGIKMGLRVDIPYMRVPELDQPEKDPVISYWMSNPRNPHNQNEDFLGWLGDIVALLKGDLDYIILGDELTDLNSVRKENWTQEDQLKFLKICSETIRKIDPKVLISGFALSSGKIDALLELAKAGYGESASAIAFNHYDYTVIPKFLQNMKEVSGKAFPLLSNGVGYISSDTPVRNPPKDSYSKYSDKDQASMIARTMYSWWANGAHTAPYYVSIRTIDYKGKVKPLWYGFFGYMDFIIDKNDNASFKRYPGWYAYRTIANIFDDRPSFTDPSFEITPSSPQNLYFRAFERKGKDLTIILWRKDNRKVPIDIDIASNEYKYPVQIDLMNHEKFSDVKYSVDGNETVLKHVETGFQPVIIRIFSATAIDEANELTAE